MYLGGGGGGGVGGGGGGGVLRGGGAPRRTPTELVNDYRDHCGETPHTTTSPLRGDPRDYDNDRTPTPKGIKRSIQAVLGMVLWYARCVRYDLMLVVSLLAARTETWNQQCQDALKRVVGFKIGRAHV